jgi:hypothetical protein
MIPDSLVSLAMRNDGHYFVEQAMVDQARR